MSKIEWTDVTWNPVTGCTKISSGCKNFYAEWMSKRLAGRAGYPSDNPFRVTYHQEKLTQLLKWKKPKRIFVCSMGDLFHGSVDISVIDQILKVMLAARGHIFMILTKRPERMRDYFSRWGGVLKRYNHIYIGVTAENQEIADERIPILLDIPAAVRFVSCEPLLSSLDLERYLMSCKDCDNQGSIALESGYDRYITSLCKKACIKEGLSSSLDWVICGGESGPGARPMHPDWVRSIRDQCVEVGVPFFFKQWGEWLSTCQYDQKFWDKISIPLKNWLAVYPDGETHHYPRLHNNYVICRAGNHLVVPMVGKIGKKAAGRLLDGRTWDQMPKPR